MAWPLVEQAQAILRQAGHEALAAELSRLVESEQQCRRAAEVNLRAIRELQAKYEPKAKSSSFINWTGD